MRNDVPHALSVVLPVHERIEVPHGDSVTDEARGLIRVTLEGVERADLIAGIFGILPCFLRWPGNY